MLGQGTWYLGEDPTRRQEELEALRLAVSPGEFEDGLTELDPEYADLLAWPLDDRGAALRPPPPRPAPPGPRSRGSARSRSHPPGGTCRSRPTRRRSCRRPGSTPPGGASTTSRCTGTAWIRSAIVDPELARAIADLQAVPGGPRLFRYRRAGELHNLTSERLNRSSTATSIPSSWRRIPHLGGTLTAAIGFAERGPAPTKAAQRRAVAAVTRTVAERLGNTPAVARSSYVAPAVVDEYLAGRTSADCRPRHLRVLGARDAALDPEEEALLVLCRGWQAAGDRVAA